MTFYCNGKKDICECDILCADCQHYDNTGGKNWQTNADRIRAMSDDELAEFIRRMVDGSNTHEVACYGCIYYGTHHSDPENKGTDLYKCDGCRSEGIGLDVLKWLRLPADLDDDEDERLPRLGRWVLLGVGGTAGPVCSVCQDKMSWFLGRTTRYCPNCGAKMIGGGDNA